jgi:benzoate 4-monooxygenase
MPSASRFGFLASGRDNYDLFNTIDARGEVVNAVGHLPLWLRPWMQHFRIDPFWYNGVRAKANLANLGRAAYGKRKAETTSRKDLLSFMLKAKDPDTGLPLPADEVLAGVISFIVGGSDTTASTMSSLMDFISRNPGLQKELYEELCGLFPSPLDEEWSASDELAGKSLLLNAVIKETLRLRPTSSTGLERITRYGGRNIAGNFYPENVSCN